MFKPATKTQAKLRMALLGPSGSGKTYTALNIAQHLGERVAVLDTEHGSASLYADLFAFDVVEPANFAPKTYIQIIQAAEKAGYDVLVIDSLSHAWMGSGGILEQVEAARTRSQSNNGYVAWKDATPQHNNLIEAILAAKLHIIVTMRVKMEYVQEKNEKTNKTEIRKVGLQPVQRDGLEYEFGVIGDLDMDNQLIIGKTRCSALRGGVFPQAGAEVAGILRAWLSDGAEPAPEPDAVAMATPQQITQLRQERGKARGRGVALNDMDKATVEAMTSDEIAAEIARTQALTAEQKAAA